MLKVTDDSGFLAVVVPATYCGFVDRDWEYEQLMNHFRNQMKRLSLLIWGTGLEGFWNVDVQFHRSSVRGFREVSGPIELVGGTLLVTNYENLTFVAAYEDESLPQSHEQDCLLSASDGVYCCRVIQMFDPTIAYSAEDDDPDFLIELTRPDSIPDVWTEIPWDVDN